MKFRTDVSKPLRPLFVALAVVSLFAVGAVGCSGPSEEPIVEPDTVDDRNRVADGGAGEPDTSNAPEDVPAPLPDLPDVDCTTDDECSAGVEALPACKLAKCVAGECVIADDEDGRECDDGSACTFGDTCAAGVCVAEDAVCDDDNACTTDGCDPLGGCVHTYNQMPCDDGRACTANDHCYLGVCDGEEIVCEDGNDCTLDQCDEVEGCVSTNSTDPCNDGDACTSGDVCQDGACTPGAPVNCGDSTACLTISCDVNSGCVQTYVEGGCDDSNLCTDGDTCMDGLCVGAIVDCDDSNACTTDKCVPLDGCKNTANTDPCNDGDACTLTDTCSGGVCVPGSPDPLCCDVDGECDDLDPCTVDACEAGYCGFSPMVCDDGSDCTSDACVGGDCTYTPYGALATGELVSSGFEDAADLASWTIAAIGTEVTWQLDQSQAHTGTSSAYCGKVGCSSTITPCPAADVTYSYDYGEVDASLSRTVSLPPGTSSLSFWAMQNLNESSCSYDVVTVAIDDGASTQILEPKLCASIPSWSEFTYDLTPFGGSSITITIRFATGDGYANAGNGIWLDDLTVEADAPAGCCALSSDCAGGEGCLLEICVQPDFKCEVAPPEMACDDDDPCTADSCDVDNACAHDPIPDCEPPCEPTCAEADACGDDGCGGSCGTCGDGLTCTGGTCACEPADDCGSVACGSIDDGCGGTLECGGCEDNETCTEGACLCTPIDDCGAAVCGDVGDGCGGTLDCGTCDAGEACDAGACVCAPIDDCGAVACGAIDDGCEGTLDCGSCGAGEACNAGVCEATAGPCDAEPCQNGGTCIDNGDSTFSCTCLDGWAGETCETSLSFSVDISGFAFVPADITVPVGATVTWTNLDGTAHSVKSMAGDGSIDTEGPLDSDLLAQDETYEFTFDAEGEFEYRCGPHSGMTGTVTVTAE